MCEIVIKNDVKENWLDNNGNYIQAHGGGFLNHNGKYYWFGEDRSKHECDVINCYSSTNLKDWKFENHIVDTNTNELVEQSNLERPKVIYNEKNDEFVMWVHRERKEDYVKAEVAIFKSKTVNGKYEFVKSFRPNGNMSRDCTLYKENNIAYFLSAANENQDLILYRLNEDYLDIEIEIKTLFEGQYREAPAICKKDNKYYIFSSFCTGWNPNQSKYSIADSIEGSWITPENIGDETTFDSQSTYILTVEGTEDTTYIFCADRWRESELHNSGYIWIPLEFDNDVPKLRWIEEWTLNTNTGIWSELVKEEI